MTQALTYDDIALVPQYSEIESRHDCDISTQDIEINEKTYYLNVPLIGAPMDTVCGPEMCIKLWKEGAAGVLHRYCTIEEQVEMVKKIYEKDAKCFVAIGATGDVAERTEELFELGCRAFCIDVAHGNHVFVKNTIDMLRSEYGDEIHIMAGNVCDFHGAYNCFKWGADSIRVGVGGGSVCSTRIVTGHGVPNLTAIKDAAKARMFAEKELEKTLYVIADGGIRTSGDAAKALAFGADFVMVGSMLAGTEETPPVQEHRKNKVLGGHNWVPHDIEYRGMASKDAQKANGRVSIVEGVSTTINYKGLVQDVLKTFSDGLKSALSYTGALNLKEFRESAEYVTVTSNAVVESQPHIRFQNDS